MITHDQIMQFTKSLKANEATIFREYVQLVFLKELYSESFSKKIYFKGGTALHFIFNAPRFSEDLDFSVELSEEVFKKNILAVFKKMAEVLPAEFKERKTIAGKRYLLTAKPEFFRNATYVNLDFSFREKVIQPERSELHTQYPILFTEFINHLSKDEMFAEKVRAILTRKKGRDLYDLWYLLNIGVKVDNEIINKKLSYYNLSTKNLSELTGSIEKFTPNDFIQDLRPFVRINERDKLGGLFIYIKSYIKNKF